MVPELLQVCYRKESSDCLSKILPCSGGDKDTEYCENIFTGCDASIILLLCPS